MRPRTTRLALVTNAILERPTCRRCVAITTALTPDDLDAALRIMERNLVLHRRRGSCRVCGKTEEVLTVDRP